MASVVFANGIKKLADGSIDFDTHVIRACLVKSSYNTTVNKDTHDFLNDVPSADRASSTFKVISSPTISVSASADKVFFGENIVTITFPTVANGVKCGGIVVFKSSGSTTTASPIICYDTFGSVVTADGGTVTVTVHANGLFQASY